MYITYIIYIHQISITSYVVIFQIMAKNLDSFPVAQWLKELRMECYRRNLDDYPTVHVSLQ